MFQGSAKRRSSPLNRGATIAISARKRESCGWEGQRAQHHRSRCRNREAHDVPRTDTANDAWRSARAAWRDWALTATGFFSPVNSRGQVIGRPIAEDELVHVLDGTKTLDIVCDDGPPKSFELCAGMIAIVPQGAWHRFRSAEGGTIWSATLPGDHIELDVDDPRMAEPKRGQCRAERPSIIDLNAELAKLTMFRPHPAVDDGRSQGKRRAIGFLPRRRSSPPQSSQGRIIGNRISPTTS